MQHTSQQTINSPIPIIRTGALWRFSYTQHGGQIAFFHNANLYLSVSDFWVISTEGRNPAHCAIFGTDESYAFSLKKAKRYSACVLKITRAEYPRFLTLANITLLARVRNDKACAWQRIGAFGLKKQNSAICDRAEYRFAKLWGMSNLAE